MTDDTLSTLRPTLFAHERLLVLFLCGGMLFLSLIAFSKPYIPEVIDLSLPEEPPAVIHVTIKGEVEKPGVYTLDHGATIQDLMEKALPLPSVDLQKVKMGSKLRDGQVVDMKKPAEKRSRSLGKEPEKAGKVKKK